MADQVGPELHEKFWIMEGGCPEGLRGQAERINKQRDKDSSLPQESDKGCGGQAKISLPRHLEHCRRVWFQGKQLENEALAMGGRMGGLWVPGSQVIVARRVLKIE